MIDPNVWAMLWPGLVLGGLPLLGAWALGRGLKSRAAVRSLQLRAALLASIVVALLPIAPLRVARPGWMPAPLAPRVAPRAPVPAAEPMPIAAPAGPAPSASELQLEPEPQMAPPAAISPRQRIRAAAEAPSMRVQPVGEAAAPSWPRIALGVWLGGALILLGWSAWCHAHIARVRRRSQVLVEGEAFEEAARIASEWKMKPPRLLGTSGIASPFASGVWRASICWPASMESEPGSEPWRAILRHEMAHCRRRDCSWNALAQASRAMLWPQPMLWWACRAIQKNAEDVCDEAALEGCAPTAYARGLLDLSQRLQAPASTCGVASRTASAGALPSQPELSRRVARILKLRGSDAWRIGWRTRIVTIAALCVVVGACVLATSEDAPRAEEAAASTSIKPGAAVSVDLSSPRAALDTFVSAVKAGNARALSQCVATVNSSEDLEEYARKLPYLMAAGTPYTVAPWRIEMERGGIAIARADVELNGGRSRGIPPGHTAMRVVKRGSTWKVSADNALAGEMDWFDGVVKTVADPEIKRLRDWARSRGQGWAQGQVLGADGSPVGGATVSLVMSGESRRRLFPRDSLSRLSLALPRRLWEIAQNGASTDSRGFYRIKGLTTGTYIVSAFSPSASGYSVRSNRLGHAPGARQIAPARTVKAHEGARERLPILKLQRAFSIEVRTLDARSGAPLKGVSYFAESAPSSLDSSGALGKSGPDGRTRLNVLPGASGQVRLSLDDPYSGAPGMPTDAVPSFEGSYKSKGGTLQFEGARPTVWNGAVVFAARPGQARRLSVRLIPYIPASRATPQPTPQSGAASTSRASSAPVQVDLSTPQAALDTFVTAVRAQDARALSQCVQTVNSAEDLEQTAKHSLRNFSGVSQWRIVAQGGETTASAFVSVPPSGSRGTRRNTTRLQLRKSAPGWRISAAASRYGYGASDPLTWAAQIVADPTIKRLNDWARSHGRAVVEGQVLGADGSPVANATVRMSMDGRVQSQLLESPLGYVLYPRDLSRMLSLSATTDARGFYRIQGLAGVAYQASAFWPARTPAAPRTPQGARWSDSFNQDLDATHIAPPQQLALREGETIQAAPLRVRPAAQLEVLALDARDQKPLQGAVFSARAALKIFFNAGRRASEANGCLTMSVPPGKVRLGLSSQSIDEHGASGIVTSRGRYTNRGATVQLDGQPPIPFPGSTSFTVQPGQTRRVIVRLTPLSALPVPTPLPAPRLRVPIGKRGTGVLIGRVQYEKYGRPGVGVVVTAVMLQPAKWDLMRSLGLAYAHGDDPDESRRWDILNRLAYARATTDARGQFRLSGLMTAPYALITSEPKPGGWPSPGTVGDKLSVAFNIWGHDGQTTRPKAPIVLISGAFIHGHVTDRSTGRGIGGVFVACYGPHRPRIIDQVASVRSQPDGSFQLRVAPGKNEIYLAGPSHTNGEPYRYVDDSRKANTYVLTLPRNTFYAGASEYQLDGAASHTDPRGTGTIVVSPKLGALHTLNFQLRRLRRATREEEAAR